MRRNIIVISCLVLLLGVAASHGEWRMRIHSGDDVIEHNVSEIDSIGVYNQIAPPTITVPAGTYIMGDGISYCGTQEREITLTRGFYLGEHEVTNQEYMEAVQWAYDNGYVTLNNSIVSDYLDGSTVTLVDMRFDNCEMQFDGAGTFYLRESPAGYAQSAYPLGYDPSNHPILMVSWFGAARYCDWISMQLGLPRAYEHGGDWACNEGDPYGAEGYRLPTDAEWEYAAQYDDERFFPWGAETPNCDLVNYTWANLPPEFCVGWTAPVGNYAAAPTALGLFDMAGNVWEWCNDWHHCNLGTDPETDPVGPTEGVSHREVRGGS